MRQIALLAAIATSLFVGTAWAGDNVWTSLGPDGGGARSLVVDPRNPNTVYAVTNGGLFKSADGGANWGVMPALPPNSGVVVDSLVIDPHNPSTLYATSRRDGAGGPREAVLKSTDGGASWRTLTSVLSAGFSAPLAIDPEDRNTLYAGGDNDIFKSADGGETWKTSNSGLPTAGCCFITRSLVIDPQNPSTVYAVTGVAIFKSTNRGASWSAVYPYSGRMEDPQFATLAIDPQNSNTLYALHIGVRGLYKSTNGGASWREANSGLTPHPGDALFFSINTVTIHPRNTGTLFAATPYGLFKSTDGAASWTKLESQPDAGGVHALALDPQDPNAIYVSADGSTGGGVHKSKDGGASWSAANSGLRALTIYRLAIAPQQPAALYAGATDWLFKSTDQGTSWNHISSVALLAIDPQDPAVLFGRGPRGQERSTDGGVNWSPANSGLPEGNCGWGNSLKIDPQNTRAIYAGLYACTAQSRNGGVWKSADGGARWAKLDSQPGGGGVHGLEIDPNTSTPYAWNGMGLFMSLDRGASWSKLRSGHVNGLTIDPQSPGTLYGVLNDEANRDCCGVFKSTDGGESWSAVNNGLPTFHLNFLRVDNVTALVIDPRHPGTLYAGTAANGVYRTTDGGASWSAVNSGLATLNVYTLAVDPLDSNTLYAGTAGGVFVITFATEQAEAE